MHLKPRKFDPVQEEIERRQPFFQRSENRAILAIVLMVVIWLIARLVGVDVPFPIHL